MERRMASAAMASPGAPPGASAPQRFTLDQYVDGILGGNRTILARAITLVESSRPDHQLLAQELIDRLLPHTGRSMRIGLTGVPGVGKSALIEALGCRLTEQGHRVAVLSIDPSSVRSGGSLLGDKTRMARLAADPNAFIRPSPTGLVLGGVARKTRETMLVCEAAGWDVVLVETVGVGQSEVTVANMTDFLLVLMLAGAGDELQGIKRGLLELADMIAVTKAEGDNLVRANLAASRYAFAMHLLHSGEDGKLPPVTTCSAFEGTGLDQIWRLISEKIREEERTGEFQARRRRQMTMWMWSLVDERIREVLRTADGIRRIADEAERNVELGTLSPVSGSQAIVRALCFSGVKSVTRAGPASSGADS
jgi:LAO/AO transport system kinase